VGRRLVFCLSLVLCLLLKGGCSPPVVTQKPRRHGAKVNLSHLFQQPAAYKGKTITLTLTIDEGSDRTEGPSLRLSTNRNVKFTARGPRGEHLGLVIWVPENVSIPEVARGDEVIVTFTCSRGDLREGNEARSIETR
jgi:hypothetical protein